MPRRLYWLVFLAICLGVLATAQDLPANPDQIHPRKDVRPKPAPNPDDAHMSPDPDKIPPASGTQGGWSSSKDTRINVAPPPGEAPPSGYNEMKPWDPHKAEKDVEVGDYYFKQKNYRAAEARYRDALYWKDNDATATYKLATALEKLGEVDEAAHNYRHYVKAFPSGDYAKQAQEALTRLQPQLGRVPGPPRSDQGEDDLRMGEFYMGLQNWPAAIAKFQDALKLKSDDPVAAFRLAQCLEKIGQIAEARQDYAQYVKLVPNGPFAAESRAALGRLPQVTVAETKPLNAPEVDRELEEGEFYLQDKKYTDAETRFRQVLQASPQNPRALFRLAQALEGNNQLNEALETYRAYLKVDPNGDYAIDAINSLQRVADRIQRQGKPAAQATSQSAGNPR